MTTWGAVCDRCSRPYGTNQWPGPSLCGRCDVEYQRAPWRYTGLKSADEIRAVS